MHNFIYSFAFSFSRSLFGWTDLRAFRIALDVDIHTKRLIFEHANAIDLNDILITSNRICIKFYFSPNERVRLSSGIAASQQPYQQHKYTRDTVERAEKTATNAKTFTFILSIFQLFDLCLCLRRVLFFALALAKIENSLSNDLRKS